MTNRCRFDDRCAISLTKDVIDAMAFQGDRMVYVMDRSTLVSADLDINSLRISETGRMRMTIDYEKANVCAVSCIEFSSSGKYVVVLWHNGIFGTVNAASIPASTSGRRQSLVAKSKTGSWGTWRQPLVVVERTVSTTIHWGIRRQPAVTI
jgi:hypothetical protein